MKYIILVFALFSAISSLAQDILLKQAEQVTFIGQLGFGSEHKLIDPYKQGTPQFDFFKDNFQIMCKWHDPTIKIPITTTIAPKETYYEGIYFLGTWVEIRIVTSSKAFRGETPLEVDIWAYSTTKGVRPQQIPATKLKLKLSNPRNKINDNTYKIEKIIGISSPEEISIPMIINYVNSRLYSDRAYNEDFLSTTIDIDRFYKARNSLNGLQYERLMKFYALMHFIEPFAQDESFLNEEARKLNFKLGQLSDSLSITNQPQKVYQDLTERYAYGMSVYKDYQSFYSKINGYYKQLQTLLFLRTPSQYSQLNSFNTNKNIKLTAQQNIQSSSSLRLAIGPSIMYNTKEIYNVFMSPRDSTVQFQNVTRSTFALSAGLVWNPFSTKKSKKDNRMSLTGNDTTRNSRSGISLGIFIDYNLQPSRKQTDSVSYSPIGLGVGFGYTSGNIGILAKVNFNLLRYPRQIFIDQFRGQNRVASRTLAYAIETRDDSIFTNTILPSVGISIVYLFSNR